MDKTADILTPQQVEIRFELAPLRDRFLAAALDQFLLWFASGIVLLGLGLAGFLNPGSMVWFILACLMILFFGNSLIQEIIWNGQTLGKRMMGIQIIRRHGGRAQPADFALRWVFRLVDIWASLFAVGSLMIATTPYAQRIGDMLADTIVVRLRSHQHIELSKLLRSHETPVETPAFPRAARFSEEDMLLAMEVLQRYQEHPTPANRQALNLLCERVRTELGLPHNPDTPERFIRKVIKEYVVLTR